MYDILIGKKIIDDKESLAKHLRKMFGGGRRIGIHDLLLSKLNRVTRLAVIGSIPKGPYDIYNSKNYPVNERMYNIETVGGSRITIKTKRRPVLRYGAEKKVYFVKNLETRKVNHYHVEADIPKGVKGNNKYDVGTALEIKEVSHDNMVTVSIHKDYIREINKYIVVGSLRRPEFHSGMVEIICVEGSKVYVYARSMGKGENVSYRGGSQRVYGYGYIPGEIQEKVMRVAKELYAKVSGVFATVIPANSDFNILDVDDKSSDELSDDGLEL